MAQCGMLLEYSAPGVVESQECPVSDIVQTYVREICGTDSLICCFNAVKSLDLAGFGHNLLLTGRPKDSDSDPRKHATLGYQSSINVR